MEPYDLKLNYLSSHCQSSSSKTDYVCGKLPLFGLLPSGTRGWLIARRKDSPGTSRKFITLDQIDFSKAVKYDDAK
eukprot:7039395-Ditylum_brightwellii.AAC.1